MVAFALTVVFGSTALVLNGADLKMDDSRPLEMPPVGSYNLRVLTPTKLELNLILFD